MPELSASMAARSTRRSRRSSEPPAAPRDVREALRQRLQLTLGCTRAPRTAALGPAVAIALRRTLPRRQAWQAGVPALQPLQDPAAEAAMSPEQVVAAYRLLRLLWLAELVFGDRELAHKWLAQPKIRLYGAAPVLLAQNPRQAGLIERWLVDIDEGNGP